VACSAPRCFGKNEHRAFNSSFPTILVSAQTCQAQSLRATRTFQNPPICEDLLVDTDEPFNILVESYAGYAYLATHRNVFVCWNCQSCGGAKVLAKLVAVLGLTLWAAWRGALRATVCHIPVGMQIRRFGRDVMHAKSTVDVWRFS